MSGIRFRALAWVFAVGSGVGGVCRADGPADNIPDSVRRIPPAGVEVPQEIRIQLEAGLVEIDAWLQGSGAKLKNRPDLMALVPDVEVYRKAVNDALRHAEFQNPREFAVASELLAEARKRAAALEGGDAYWLRQHGPVVRGFRSRLDGSVQPYGLEIPATYDFDHPRPTRLDFWFHGRGEKTNEVSFIQGRTKGGGKVTPVNTIVLHPYARFSNANKFAGEIDCLEALEHAQRNYRIDADRILVRGFSMGGAACWQFAVHYADRWAAAQPGAGFSETPNFLRTFQGETLNPKPWEKTLWHWYDCTDWAVNLANLPIIAYSGEIDRQKQAADMMTVAMEEEGMELVHLIGPGMGHKFHPDVLADIEQRLARIADRGRERVPRSVHFTTWTLRYNTMFWLHVDALTEHWQRARVDAEWQVPNAVFVDASGVEEFSLVFKSGECPLDPALVPVVQINGKAIEAPRVLSDRSWTVRFRKVNEKWQVAETAAKGLRKRHGLQGPIDDAFMDSFMMVRPTGKAQNSAVGEWTATEMDHALTHWRQHFRGDARVKDDGDISDEDIAAHHLVLWGDPSSNSVLARIADKLPIRWSGDSIEVGGQKFAAADHALAMIFPNPLNPDRYVVINSGFTYREYDYLNNARQTAKLPDWAIIDVREPVTSQYPGGLPAAGFFDESWKLRVE